MLYSTANLVWHLYRRLSVTQRFAVPEERYREG